MTRYAHFFRARGGLWELVITLTPALNCDVIFQTLVENKTEARKIAAEFNAQPWNF